MVDEAANSRPITITAPKSKKSDTVGKRGELGEKEQKKLHLKLQALTNQLIDAKREQDKIEKDASDWKAIAEKNEKALNILSDKLLDPKDKIKKMDDLNAGGTSAKVLKQQLKQQERILELGEKLEHLSNKNEELERFIKVESQSEIAAYESSTKEANKRLQAVKSENISLQTQIDKLVNASTPFEKNEEAEYARQMNVKNMEERIRELEAGERDLHEEMLRSEHK
jgi:chromosome segregation ATPase